MSDPRLYYGVMDALGTLRVALLRENLRAEDVSINMPIDTIRSIEASMPIEHSRARGIDAEYKLRGFVLRPNEQRNREIMDLEREVRDLRRRLKRRDVRDQACAEGMARIMNAVPIADAVGAGENVQTLVDYVIGRIGHGAGTEIR